MLFLRKAKTIMTFFGNTFKGDSNRLAKYEFLSLFSTILYLPENYTIIVESSTTYQHHL